MAEAPSAVSMQELGDLLVAQTSILRSLDECHDLCVRSELFSSGTVQKVNSCAVQFKQLSQGTIAVVRKIGPWLGEMVVFFKSIDRVSASQVETLCGYGRQAKDLAECFRMIAKWGRMISGNFHAMKDYTSQDARKIKQRFKTAKETAEEREEEKSDKLRRAEKIRRDAKATEGKWNIARAATLWSPLGLVVTSIGSAVSHSSTEQAEKLEREAEREHSRAVQNLQEKTNDYEKAKFIVGKAEELLQALSSLDKACEAAAAFWTVQADTFEAQGSKMRSGQAAMIKSKSQILRGKAIENNVKFWSKAKSDVEQYVTVISKFNNSINIRAATQPSPTRAIHFSEIGLTLSLPAGIAISYSAVNTLGDDFSKMSMSSGRHPRHRCDGCQVKPIQGPRFHCKLCPDFDFCGSCFASGLTHTHSFEQVNDEGAAAVCVGYPGGYHPRHRCDGCMKYPISGPRFHCTTCPDFDFCQSCFYRSLTHKHVFSKIEDEGGSAVSAGQPGGTHPRYRCDGCRVQPIRGQRFHCTSCPDFDFCQSCFKRNSTHRHVFKCVNDDGQRGMRVGYPPAANIHPRHGCDGCGEFPIRGVRFHCETCYDFDFCEECFDRKCKSHDHSFQRFEGQSP